MSTILGCCAGRHEQNINVKTSNDIMSIFGNQICIIEYDLGHKALDFFREIPGTDITEIGGKAIVTYAHADGMKIRNKKYFDKHEELQKRDGRQKNELKEGDMVAFANNPSISYKYRVGGFSRDYPDHVTVQIYDSYYKKWNNYASYRPETLLRIE